MYKPWIEKYRPTKLNDIILNDVNKKIINNMLKTEYYPNLILYGPPGTGKTTTILCIINEYQKKHNCTNNYIHLNASHERGINIIRNEIYQFTQNNNIFNNCQKFILLDEIDSMTKQAQNNLYYIIEQCNNKNITFILICNYLNKIIHIIRNNLLILHFNKTSLICNQFLKKCIKNENMVIKKDKLDLIKNNNLHDLRNIINELQNYDKTDIIINDNYFKNILNQKNYITIYHKINKYYDNRIILQLFLDYLYRNDMVDDNIIEMIQYLLFQNIDNEFIFYEFIPYIKNKLI